MVTHCELGLLGWEEVNERRRGRAWPGYATKAAHLAPEKGQFLEAYHTHRNDKQHSERERCVSAKSKG